MLDRFSEKTVLGPILALAIMAPGIAPAQSLFGAPSAGSATTDAGAAASPASAAAHEKKSVDRKVTQKSVPSKDATKVNVFNERGATLVELSLTSDTAKDPKPQIVAHDLASGKKITATLARKGGCIFSVSGKFDDESTIELSALDLCKDNNLNLIE
jgi:hypothetical protein